MPSMFSSFSLLSVRTRFFVFNPAFFPLCSLCVLCVLCANPVFNLWNENRGIAPSQEEGALTPRCLFTPCSLCELDFLFLIQAFFPLCSLCVLCVLCANPVFNLWNENRGIAPSQEEGALTPRCLFTLCSPCELDFLFLIQAFFPLCSLCVLCVLCANPVF